MRLSMPGYAVVLALWTSGGQSKFLEEQASPRNRMVLLWGPSLPAQLLVH